MNLARLLSVGVGLDAVVAQISAAAVLPVVIETSGRGGRVPVAVAAAIRDAALEAIRNIDRHTDCQHATLIARARGSHIRMIVRDDGPGIGQAVPGFGLTSSVLGRTDEVGVEATVTTGPRGIGTDVILDWTPTASMSIAACHEATLARSGGASGLAIIVPTTAAANLWLMVRHAGSAHHPPAMYALGIGITLITAAITVVIRRRPLTTLEVCFLVAILSLLIPLGVWSAGPGATADFRSWHVGYLALPLTILAFVLPSRWAALLLGGACLGLIAGAHWDSATPPISSLGFYLAMLPAMLIGHAFGVLLRITDSATGRLRRSVIRTQLYRTRLQRESRSANAQIEYSATHILPWLDRIAGGSPISTEERNEAALLMREVRDDLVAPNFFGSDLRAKVKLFRARGGDVQINPGMRAVDRRHPVYEALALLAEAPPARITISQRDDRVRLGVVPPVSGDASHAFTRLGGTVESDEYSSIVTFAASPKPPIPETTAMTYTTES